MYGAKFAKCITEKTSLFQIFEILQKCCTRYEHIILQIILH